MKIMRIRNFEFTWLDILAILILIGCIIWEIISRGQEAIVSSLWAAIVLIISRLWLMNNILKDNNHLLKDIAAILKEIRDSSKKGKRIF